MQPDDRQARPAENENDLEAVPLPFIEEDAGEAHAGTTIILSGLDSRLNFPTPDRFREVLVHEYGREDAFKVFVNEARLSVDDVPGVSREVEKTLIESGSVRLRFTIADGKKSAKITGYSAEGGREGRREADDVRPR